MGATRLRWSAQRTLLRCVPDFGGDLVDGADGSSPFAGDSCPGRIGGGARSVDVADGAEVEAVGLVEVFGLVGVGAFRLLRDEPSGVVDGEVEQDRAVGLRQAIDLELDRLDPSDQFLSLRARALR